MSYISPLLLFSILFALSLSRERVENGLHNLFTAPLSRWDILVGKASLYLGAAILYSLGIGFFISSGFAAIKIALVYIVLSLVMLSFSLYTMIASRTYRELTFIGSFALFTFFFFIILPNVFSGVNVLAYISPLDLVTSIQYGAHISDLDITLSLLPYISLAGYFISFTVVCFHSEVIVGNYSLKRLFREFYSGLAKKLKNPLVYTAFSIALMVPFVFIIESILAYLIMPLGPLAPLITIPFLAAIEEGVKILPFVYRKTNPVSYSIVAGSSFFFAEKIFNAYLISKVYALLGGPYVMYVVKGAVVTWFIHIVTVFIFALMIHQKRKPVFYLFGVMCAIVVHLIYNIQVIYGVL